MPIPTMITGMPNSNGRWLRMTKSLSQFISLSTDAAFWLRRSGSQQIKPGSRNIVKAQTPIMPAATMLPSWRNGGEMEKLSDKKPMAVVKTATVMPRP